MFDFFCFSGNCGSIVLCISPLTSLMVDQRAKYSPKGLNVEFVGEAQTDLSCKRRVLNGEVQLVFITPENLLDNKTYREMLLSQIYQSNLVALAVDEAHCVKSWGDQFRKAFARIGDLRSLIPKNVNVLALTATATTETLSVVIERLSMHNVTIVAVPPSRDNVMYKIMPKVSSNIHAFTDKIVEEISSMRLKYPKTIVYVRTYKDCISLYQLLKSKMGHNFTEPIGYPNLSGYRLIEMYTRLLPSEKKDEVLYSFSAVKTNIRLVIATTAFGMGVDCQDISRVIHWGIPSTTEEYIQETGRSGRNGKPSVGMLYIKGNTKHVTPYMKSYIENNSLCRRNLLFKNYLMYSEKSDLYGCQCCDICCKTCVCVKCTSQ